MVLTADHAISRVIAQKSPAAARATGMAEIQEECSPAALRFAARQVVQ
jgi:hypothetical protein